MNSFVRFTSLLIEHFDCLRHELESEIWLLIKRRGTILSAQREYLKKCVKWPTCGESMSRNLRILSSQR